MNYRLRRQGEDLGVFSLEELRRRREAGELTGSEYVQGEGRPDWQPLGLVLQQGYYVSPPPLPTAVAKRGPTQGLVWVIVTVGVIGFILFVGFIAYSVRNAQRRFQSAINSASGQESLSRSSPDGLATASKPIRWAPGTQTVRDVQRRAREFKTRQWLEGYEKRGRRNPASDARAEEFIRVYVARNSVGVAATNTLSLEAESDRLARDPNCTDPLVLTVAADNSRILSDGVQRFERALAEYPGTAHWSYPKFYATIRLMGLRKISSNPEGTLDASALQELRTCFADGSFTPGDQQGIADILVDGWGSAFFKRNGAAVCHIANEAGQAYHWLALTLDGENHIAEAWKARGSGYANTVTEQGWKGFRSHLDAAHNSLNDAWNLQPDFPLAPCRMMTVSLGEAGIEEMRVWFDRALAAQVDHPGAWSEMRWGLRPRWYGSEAAMLALGRTAIDTGRFDTDVPNKFLDCIADLESELSMPAGRHIYGRADIWPELQRMYDGYIAACIAARSTNLKAYRSSYAVVAYLAGKYDVARSQLEALDWKPPIQTLVAWRVDPVLLPLEVAARTGPLGEKIAAAEIRFQSGDRAGARLQYTALSATTNEDVRTREFIQRRLGALTEVQKSPALNRRQSPAPSQNPPATP